ncbi:MAG: hypothetical protein IJR47_00195 [Clostridia bacterium]|nr:hypothetical protein [Clostridia bacterium]
MSSSAKRIKLPGIDEIQKFHGEYDVMADVEATTNIVIDPEEVIREAKLEAEQIIAKAHEKAVSIEESAKKEAEKLKEVQGNIGYIEGKSSAEKEVMISIEQDRAAVEREIEALRSYRDEMFEVIKKHFVDCLKLVSKKIILREFDENSQIINDMIDKYYYMIKDRSSIVLKVSKDDYFKLDMIAMEGRGIKVMVDETFKKGDMIITCDAEGINFGLEEQIHKMENSIGG